MAVITPENKWVNDLSPNSVVGADIVIVDPSAGIAQLNASRTSDAPMAGSEGCQGGMDLVYNNEASVPMHAYGRYIEAFHGEGVNGKSTTQGLEIASINLDKDSPSVDPFNQDTDGLTETFRAGAGKAGEVCYNISAAFQITNVNGKYHRGWVVGNNSIVAGSNGLCHAGLMPSGYVLSWWKGAGQLDGYITIDHGVFKVYANGQLIFSSSQSIWTKIKSWLGI